MSRTDARGPSRPMVAVGVLAAVLAVLAAGCTMIPAYQRPASPVPVQFPDAATAENPGAASTASTASTAPPASPAPAAPGAAPAAPAAEMSWRSFINDERLRRLVELALANNRDLRVAVLNVEQAQAQYRVTRASSFPALDADAGYTASRSASGALAGFAGFPGLSAGALTTHQWSASIGTSAYELDLFGRVRSLNRQALEKFFATAEAQRDAQISLVAQVATQYFTLREAEEQLKLARETLASVQGSYDLNRITFDAGEANELDLRTAEGQVQTAKVNVVTYERERAQALDALVLLVGRPLPADLPAPPPFDAGAQLAPIPPGLPSDLVQRRPDILEAEHTLEAANANIGAARAAFFPTISLTGSLGTASTQLSGLLGAGSGTWNFAPQISVPIFAGGQNRANLDVARISTRIEVADYEKAIQTAFREVADALVGADTYARQMAAQADAIKAQQRRLELATLRYRHGEDTYLNVLSAQQDLYSAQQGRLTAQFNRLASQVALYQALGGGWK